MYVLRNKETGAIIDPRIDSTFMLDPADLGYETETWDDVFKLHLSENHETDLVEGFEVIDYEVPNGSILFSGKNYKIVEYHDLYLLIGPSQDYLFDSFEELVESHPICEEAREVIFGNSKAESMATATIYRRSGQCLKRNVATEDAFSKAEEYVAMLCEPVLVVIGGQCWEVSDVGDAEELEEWAVDE